MDEQQQQTDETPIGAASELSAGLGRCWPWTHKYTVWTDTHTVTKSRCSDNTVLAHGVVQERRCQLCGKLQLRTVWV